MRASGTVAVFCLAAGVAPSFAAPSIKSERAVLERGISNLLGDADFKKAVKGEMLKAAVSATLATGILTTYTTISQALNNHPRDLLEGFDELINQEQELAARAHKRGLLDDLD